MGGFTLGTLGDGTLEDCTKGVMIIIIQNPNLLTSSEEGSNMPLKSGACRVPWAQAEGEAWGRSSA